MFKKLLPPFAGVAARRLRDPRDHYAVTPNQQPRNPDNQYAVETAFDSQQQSLRWDSIQAYVLVNGRALPMRPCPW